MEKETGGPAFPTEHTDTSGQFDGMTLRDYFAAVALPVIATGSHNIGEDFLDPRNYSTAAFDAYKMADAMLKERNK